MELFEKSTYIRRRDVLCKLIGKGLILLPGNNEASVNYLSNTYHFRQDSTFLYYFGLNHPDFAGVLDAETGEAMLFGDDYTIDDIIWMGPQPSLSDLGSKVGITKTYPFAELQKVVAKATPQGRTIHYLPPYRGETTLLVSSLLNVPAGDLSEKASVKLAKAVVAMREIKEDQEVSQIEEACEIGYQMHTLMMQTCRPGVVEREIAGAVEGMALRLGAGVSFTSIVSQHGETLHNHYYDNTLEAGKLLLMDAGAETVMNYCSDFTRTVPVSGKFSPQQRDVYNIVLAANARAFETAKPGARYADIHNESAKVLAQGLKDLGLLQGSVDDIVAKGAQALFMPHGLGHQLGLDVHDMENIGEKYVGYDEETLRSSTPGLSSLRMGKRLKPGMAMTVEPGTYFIPELIAKWKKENLGHGFINFPVVEKYLGFGGIRIEDNILITENGKRMLGKRRAPATVEEIEAFMAK